ncbi:cell number regulator 2-like [Herrania umbratica]|uniref:Cell number regulator 2-like n=1 Tax=Herrania umbratica TaxID=108875 RepID=A0A6J1B213_9ROSI|nr:cell number regulator 2-like [Herrania umbratica]XP_021293383.1 cell number regulator 2-like [Herrania umbratica]
MASLPVNSVSSKLGQVNPWSTELFDCFSDSSLCCKTCCCPCITFGQNAEIIDQGSSSCFLNASLYVIMHHFTGCGLSFLYGYFYRRKLRHQYGLKQSPCHDICVHCCCHYCALCQEQRELRSQGYDMLIGWQANVERQNRGVTMAPMAYGGMKR